MLEWFQENPWALWLTLAAGLAIAEMLTLDLTLLMLAVGALVGVGAALLLRQNLAIYGLGGVLVPFVGIKAIDLLVSGMGLV